ncbi:hypothetical protein KKH23_06860 [Patescibacteria group bacterium]|uniref:Holin n=1 Tax=viral metagenome TaxID=1070528 RepID=A0A6M3M2G7_9ZZZZ|nr:hypothetical protein [Patescibacteria group bacterium]MBU0846896.1 hypothetical protein [Patescibacteria group bacterium]
MEESLRSLIGLGSVPFVIGLVEIIKKWVGDGRYYPLFAIAFGLAINLIVAWAFAVTGRVEWVGACLVGMLAGLAASGLYSAGERIGEG